MRDISSPLDGFSSPFGPQQNRTLTNLLFGQNEPGFTFEPWDITTMYVDRAGTTPVTAAGQSVGLRLDKSKGLALGAELVMNGAFDADTDWIKGAGWTISGGALNAVSASSQTIQFMTFAAGSVYRVNLVIPEFSAGTLTINLGGDVSYNVTGSGTISINLRVPSVSVGALFITGTGFTGSIDNISVRELAGNHEVAISDAKRGVYGWMPKTGRRNLLTYSEQFDNDAWFKSGSTVTANTTTAPDGTATADTIVLGAVGNLILQDYSTTVNGTYVASVYLRSDAPTTVVLTIQQSGGASSSLTCSLTTSWQRFEISKALATLTFVRVVLTTNSNTPTFYAWGAQLELGSTATAYQRVVSNYDITEAGVPTCYYVQADGVDDAYVTPTITPNTDKVQVFAGVRRLGNVGYNVLIETSASFDLNNGVITIGNTDSWVSGSKGTVASTASFAASAPVSAVLTGLGDISADRATLRVNGAQVAQTTTDQGTGNYLAYPAYIYARGGTSPPFNGLDFGHAVRFGPNLDAATIARVESLIARNTPEVTL